MKKKVIDKKRKCDQLLDISGDTIRIPDDPTWGCDPKVEKKDLWNWKDIMDIFDNGMEMVLGLKLYTVQFYF